MRLEGFLYYSLFLLLPSFSLPLLPRPLAFARRGRRKNGRRKRQHSSSSSSGRQQRQQQQRRLGPDSPFTGNPSTVVSLAFSGRRSKKGKRGMLQYVKYRATNAVKFPSLSELKYFQVFFRSVGNCFFFLCDVASLAG